MGYADRRAARIRAMAAILHFLATTAGDDDGKSEDEGSSKN
jgi:hypothetical protein